MYGLPQAGSLENKILQKILAAYSLIPTLCTPGMWWHETRAIKLSLLVDDFVVEYE